ncbi:MAG: hypothetical protein WCV88_03075 [Patescibacteria group bacterium]
MDTGRKLQPADTGVEIVKDEIKTVPPKSAQQVLDVTFRTGTNDGALESLSRRVADKSDAVVLVGDIETRLEAFAVNTSYPALLYRAAGNGAPLNPAEQTQLRTLQGYLIGELNPKFYNLQELIRTIDVLDAVQTGLYRGEAGAERVTSLFGLMQAVHDQDPTFPILDFTTPVHPGKEAIKWVGEIDPLDGATHQDYWQTRLEIRRDRAPRTLPNELRRRSDTLAYDLEHAPDHAAYQTLITWIDEHSKLLRDDMSPAELADYRATLHFAHGDSEDVIALLNAAEKVKATNPLLFLQMIGVTPGHDYAEPTAARSGVFGNVFHLALYRSLHLSIPEDNEGLQLFKKRVEALLEVDTPMPELTAISDAAMRTIDAQFRQAATEQTVHPVLLAGMYMQFMPGYKIRHDLEAMLKVVSFAERERTLHRLKTGTPDVFFATWNSLPEVMQNDPEIKKIKEARVGTMKLKTLTGPIFEDMRLQIWETVSDTALLCDEFQHDLTKEQRLHRLDRQLGLRDVWEAHPNITQEQWLKWYDGLVEREAQAMKDESTFQRARRAWQKRQGVKPKTVAAVWRKILKPTRLYAMAKEVDSKVFIIGQRLIEDDPNVPESEKFKKYIETIYNYRPNGEPGAIYRVLQRIVTPDQFVEQWGRIVREGDFEAIIEAMPEADRKVLLQKLFDPKYNALLEFAKPLEAQEVTVYEEGQPKTKKIDRITTLDQWRDTLKKMRDDDPNLFDNIYFDNIINYKHDWQTKLFRLAEQYIPNDPGFISMQQGEQAIDQLSLRLCYQEDYRAALWSGVVMFQHNSTTAEVKKLIPGSIDNLQKAVLVLLPNQVRALAQELKKIVIREINLAIRKRVFGAGEAVTQSSILTRLESCFMDSDKSAVAQSVHERVKKRLNELKNI